MSVCRANYLAIQSNLSITNRSNLHLLLRDAADASCECFSPSPQGPGSMFRSFRLHPLLFLNGIINISYYVGEVLLYHHPLGLVFIVIAALSATFIINPLESFVGLGESDPVPNSVIALALIGSVLCVLERKYGEEFSIPQMYRRAWRLTSHWGHRLCTHPSETQCAACAQGLQDMENGSSEEEQLGNKSAYEELAGVAASSEQSARGGSLRRRSASGELHGDESLSHPLIMPTSMPFVAPDDSTAEFHSPAPVEHKPHHRAELVPQSPTSSERDLDPSRATRGAKNFTAILRDSVMILVPFLMLSISYGLWFVTQKLFNDEYRTNIFGYTSIDQVWAPVYMWVFLLLVDHIAPLRAMLHSAEDRKESWAEAVKNTFSILFCQRRGRGFFTVFTYRLLINARAIAYFYMGVTYDLAAVYLELTLVRVMLSWVLAGCVCALKPSFIGLSKAERNTVFAPVNIGLRLAGTAFVLAALFILNASQ